MLHRISVTTRVWSLSPDRSGALTGEVNSTSRHLLVGGYITPWGNILFSKLTFRSKKMKNDYEDVTGLNKSHIVMAKIFITVLNSRFFSEVVANDSTNVAPAPPAV